MNIYFFIIQDFWATCACPEKQLPWIFSLYWNIFYHSGLLSNQRLPWQNRVALKIFTVLNILFTFKIFEQLALALKNRVALEFFTVLNMYFLSFRIFEQLALALKNRGCPEFTALNMYFLLFRSFEQPALALKNRVVLEFSLYWIYFLHSGFLSNFRLPWKTELPWNFSLFWICTVFPIIQDIWATCSCPEKQSCLGIFHCIEIFFLSFRIFEQLAVALKTEFALKFFKPGCGHPPPRTPMIITFCQRY